MFKAFSARSRWAISNVRKGSSRQRLERFEIVGLRPLVVDKPLGQAKVQLVDDTLFRCQAAV